MSHVGDPLLTCWYNIDQDQILFDILGRGYSVKPKLLEKLRTEAIGQTLAWIFKVKGKLIKILAGILPSNDRVGWAIGCRRPADEFLELKLSGSSMTWRSSLEIVADSGEPTKWVETLELEYMEIHILFAGSMNRDAEVSILISAQLWTGVTIVSTWIHAHISYLFHCDAMLASVAYGWRNNRFFQM